MSEQWDTVTVRQARREDRSAVLGFCLETWSWGDYIPEVYDTWLADSQGRLLVATIDGVPVGLQHVAFVAPGETWLQGLRVDPAFRRRGVARALYASALDLARERGSNLVRLLTAADNTITQPMLIKDGWRVVARVAYLTADADAGVGPVPESGVPGEVDALWQLIADSQDFRLLEGVFVRSWRGLSLTKGQLATLVAAGEVRVLRRSGRPVAAAVLEPPGAELAVSGLYGDHQSVARLARLLRAQAASAGAGTVAVLVPDVPEVLAPLTTAGYARSHGEGTPPMVLYAKDLLPV
jgi:ribosomal protein S18 acetylase RimI-like enzyme